jgi:AcrR family transcriptional regulator
MSAIIFDNYKIWLDEQKIPKGQKKALLAGLDLFAKQGYNGTSTAQIAEKAEISQATIFKYFKTKQDLLVAIIKPVFENLFPVFRDGFINELSQFTTLEDVVRFFIYNRYQFVVDNEDAIMILISESLTNSDLRQAFFDVANEPGKSVVENVSDILARTGELRPELDFPAVLRTIAGQVLIYFMQHRFIGQQDEEKDLNLIVEQIIRAIKK